MPDVIHRTDCRACGSRDLEPVFSLKPTPIGDAYVTADRLDVPQPSYPIDLHMCRGCGLAQIVDVVDPEILYGDYIYVTSSSLGLPEHFQRYATTVIERCALEPGALVVDIGSNDGTLLRFFRDRGMRVLGIEPAARIAAEATAAGVETISEFFTADLAQRIVRDYGPARLVTANNVFANIDDLPSWVQAIDKLLAPDGVFVFESYYLADLVKNLVFDFIYHEHLSAFSVKPVQRLFETVGLELAAVERVPTKGGSLRYFVQRSGGPLRRDGSVEELSRDEDRLGLYEKSTFTAFAKTVDDLKRSTRSFLTQVKNDGKSIAGFGASITGTTLIYQFELGGYLDYLVDDNPAKQGRYSPGLHLPVLPSSALYEKKPDYVVILAWRYADPFIRKHQRFLAQGGRFVVPVPKFNVVGPA